MGLCSFLKRLSHSAYKHVAGRLDTFRDVLHKDLVVETIFFRFRDWSIR